jgi:hypothetical protein
MATKVKYIGTFRTLIRPKKYIIKIKDLKPKTEIIRYENKDGSTSTKIREYKRFQIIDKYGMNRIFIEDKRISKIKNYHTQKKASKKALIDYFSRRSGTKYKPTSKEDGNKKVEKVVKQLDNKDLKPDVYNYANGNRILFTNNKISKRDYNKVAIWVKVKVWLDGVSVYSYGRGDWKLYSDFDERTKMKDTIIARNRALAPYGSKVKYDMIYSKFGYHQRQNEHFGARAVRI